MYVHSPKLYQPHWLDQHTYFGAALPAQRRKWLLDEGSLTEHLVRASAGNFSVAIIAQRWGRPLQNEAMLLDIAPRHRCLLREVFLLCYGKPWVYARSVLPHASLQGPIRHLRKFGDQPLGQLLFNNPTMRRDPFQFTSLPRNALPNWPPPGSAVENTSNKNDSNAICMGRRSRFILEKKPLMVSEIFLPAFWQGI
ncbi:MAG: chorismate lyase [Pseudomonadales bacterium]|nr:chorismate lyase [Pseudomonadales bacterium]